MTTSRTETPLLQIDQLNIRVGERLLVAAPQFACWPERLGLIGRNGVGKSQLLEVLAGRRAPDGGVLTTRVATGWLSQTFEPFEGATVASLFPEATQFAALQRVLSGSFTDHDLNLVDDDWDVETRIAQTLADANLSHLVLDQPLTSLSSGELMRARLAALLHAKPGLLLLDEPTNHLDQPSKDALIELIATRAPHAVIASHDRALLAVVDRIVEIEASALHFYGGNHASYATQKAFEREAAERDLADARKVQRQAQATAQESKERAAQRTHAGKKLRRTGSQCKGLLDKEKERSQHTQKTLAIRAERILADAAAKLDDARANLHAVDQIRFRLPESQDFGDRVIVELDGVDFGYQPDAPLIRKLSLQVRAGSRFAIVGGNGAGKTTLIKLMTGELEPQAGRVRRSPLPVAAIDQALSFPEPARTLLDWLQELAPEQSETALRLGLAAFLFPGSTVHQTIASLSGGERLRFALACRLLVRPLPALLVLDEPTNHLDLPGIECIEAILRDYRGALVVVSHDAVFLERLELETLAL